MIPIDSRPTSVVGRHARLDLVFGYRNGRTVLEHSYAEPPFRVGHAFSEGMGQHLIMASSAPGVFGGDMLQTHVRVRAGASVRLTSQSALQAHPAADGKDATLHATYDVEPDGRLHCHWDPLIPFAHARLNQRIDVRLSGDACLYWSDGWTAGREGRSERWQFDSMRFELRISRNGELEYLERFAIPSETSSLCETWTAHTSCYFGTIVRSGGSIDRDCVDRAHSGVSRIGQGLLVAADLLGDRLALVRLMSQTGPPFHRARREAERHLGDLEQFSVLSSQF